MHKVLVNSLGGLSLPRKSVARLTDCPNMTLDVYCGCSTTTCLTCTLEVIFIHDHVFGNRTINTIHVLMFLGWILFEILFFRSPPHYIDLPQTKIIGWGNITGL